MTRSKTNGDAQRRLWSYVALLLTLGATIARATTPTLNPTRAPTPSPTSVGPCRDNLLEAGVDDHFSTTNGAEPAAPSQGLQTLINAHPVLPRSDFDGVLMNSQFGHTFVLPTDDCIVAARLEIRVQPLADAPNGSDNDAITLGFVNSSGQLGTHWSAYFGNGNSGLPALLGSQWVPGNFPAGNLFTLDLGSLPGGTSLLAELNAKRSLDIYIQDDTSVDYIRLIVSLCPCPIPTPTLTPTATPTSIACVGDCDGDGVVTINEIILLANIALGNLPVSACTAGDSDGDGNITVNEIIAAVNNALNGCPCGFTGPRMCGGTCPNPTDICQPLPDDSGCVCRPTLLTPSPTPTRSSTPTPSTTGSPCVPTPAHMVAWWPLNEPSGSTTVVDIGLPPANNGTAQPGAIGVTGPSSLPGNLVTTPPDTALLFPVPSVYAEVPSSNDLNLANSNLTIDAWIDPVEVHPALPGTIQVVEPIVDKLGSTNTGYALYLQITAQCPACPASGAIPVGTQQLLDMHLVFVVGGVSYLSNSIYAATYVVNPPSLSKPWPGWMHIAVTIDRGTGNGIFYLDGSAAGTFVPAIGVDSASSFLIGGTRLFPTPFGIDGEIAINELEVFNVALSQPDIQSIAHASAGKCRSTSPTATPTLSATQTQSATATRTATPTATPSRTASAQPSSTPTTTPTATKTTRASATATPTSTCIPAPSDMVLWLSADNNANDLSGNGNNGALHGAASYTVGEVGNAFSLPTIADYVQVPDSPTLNFAANFSIDAWINTTNPTVARATIVDKRAGSNTNPVGYHLFLFNGLLGFQLSDGQPFLNNVSPGPLVDDGTWHHVAATINRGSSSGGNLYVDGQLVYTFDPTTRPGSIINAAPLRLGVRLVGGAQAFENFQGAIDEVEIFARELGAGEISALYASRSSGKCKTPLPTRTPSPTVTHTPTRTSTSTFTFSLTPTLRPSNTPTRTATASLTATPTQATRTPTRTATASRPPTATATPTATSPCGEPRSLLLSTGNGSIGGSDPLWWLAGAPGGTGGFPPAHSATIIGSYGGWATLPNTQWVSANSVCGTTTGCPVGLYEYEFCWRQCGELIDTTPFMILADNRANVLLDGNLLVTVPGFTTPTSFSFNTAPGTHSLLIDVFNDPYLNTNIATPTGMDLSGFLSGQIDIVQCPIRPPTLTPTPSLGCPGGMCTPTPTRTPTSSMGGNSITIIKNTVPDGPQDFTFTASGGLVPSTFLLDDDNDPTLPNSQAFTNVPTGNYTIAEIVPAGWMVTSIGCVGPGASFSTGASSVSIFVPTGTNVTCTFKNEPRPTATVTRTNTATPTRTSTATKTPNGPPPD
ncbi:MAG: hypothetical protein HY270_18020 [Deltaproteobacteria bacterium]|nr:hypothetical protein [Deltaproteobacteria bacterium]